MRLRRPAGAPLQQTERTYVLAGRRKLVYFGGCDYFRLSSQPAVREALESGLQDYGLNVAASRRTTGNHQLYERLEKELAVYFATEAAILFSSGYASNLATAQALTGKFTHALLDERAHASLYDAAQFLDARRLVFKHRQPADLQRQVKRLGAKARIIVLTDGLFAHDGSVAPLQRYDQVLPRSAWLFVDDAHAAGILGAHGRGSVELENIPRRRVLQSITLSKAFGVYGGAVLTSHALQKTIVTHSRYYAGNTPLPLPLAAAALEAVRWLKGHPQLRARLHQNIRHVQTQLRDGGWDAPVFPGPIISLIPKNAREAADFSRRLLRAGIHPPFIHYPGGPSGGYFRFALSSEHTRAQLNSLIAVLKAGPLRCAVRASDSLAPTSEGQGPGRKPAQGKRGTSAALG